MRTRAIFEAVLKEAATRATAQIIDIEKGLGAEFKKKGKEVVAVNRAPIPRSDDEAAQRARRDLAEGCVRQAASD